MSRLIEKLMRFILRSLKLFLQWSKKILKSNEFVKNLLLEMNSAQEFTNLYGHERMIADSVRVEHYQAGIRRHIKPGYVIGG